MTQHTPFRKMQGLGNDFIIIDQRVVVPEGQINWQKLADRRHGVGCDQIILLNESHTADIFMRIINADGSEVHACGNATRCVGKLLLQETGKSQVSIETYAGHLSAQWGQGDVEHITAIMPPPQLNWQQIPLKEEVETLAVSLEVEGLPDGCAVSIGNPHIVFFVEDVSVIPLEQIGKDIEHHPLFPERTNVEMVQVLAPDHLKMRVWERGAGITKACGTGACASLIAAVRRGLSDRRATVEMPGGSLMIEWLPATQGGKIAMTGEAQEIFRGEIDFSLFFK